MEEKSYQQMRKEFQQQYFNKIVPLITFNENERKKYLFITKMITFVAILIAIGYYVFSKVVDIGVIIAICIFAAAGKRFLKKKFEKVLKDTIMPKVCKCFGNLRWNNNNYSGFSDLFVNAYIIPQFDLSFYDDIFYGKHKDVNFEIIEATFCSTKQEMSLLSSKMVCNLISTYLNPPKSKFKVFNGVIVKLAMNKNFTGNTIIQPNSIMHSSPSSSLKHTTLEDVEFEKHFDVYTNDEVEARYLITPSFMERLKSMQIAFKADKVSCAFYDKYLFIALHTQDDVFSIGDLAVPVDDDKQYFTMFEEILSIIQLIDHFKLEQKIGL